jgi:hypothetical protein|tara:strand:+ start:57 stop:470 length:414 start_codon:yes stop_codon:yes gene_type:complete
MDKELGSYGYWQELYGHIVQVPNLPALYVAIAPNFKNHFNLLVLNNFLEIVSKNAVDMTIPKISTDELYSHGRLSPCGVFGWDWGDRSFIPDSEQEAFVEWLKEESKADQRSFGFSLKRAVTELGAFAHEIRQFKFS